MPASRREQEKRSSTATQVSNKTLFKGISKTAREMQFSQRALSQCQRWHRARRIAVALGACISPRARRGRIAPPVARGRPAPARAPRTHFFLHSGNQHKDGFFGVHSVTNKQEFAPGTVGWCYGVNVGPPGWPAVEAGAKIADRIEPVPEVFVLRDILLRAERLRAKHARSGATTYAEPGEQHIAAANAWRQASEAFGLGSEEAKRAALEFAKVEPAAKFRAGSDAVAHDPGGVGWLTSIFVCCDEPMSDEGLAPLAMPLFVGDELDPEDVCGGAPDISGRPALEPESIRVGLEHRLAAKYNEVVAIDEQKRGVAKQSQLDIFLEALSLTQFGKQPRHLGAEAPADLAGLDEEDFVALGMTKMQKLKLEAAVVQILSRLAANSERIE